MKKKYQKPVVVVYKEVVEANAKCYHEPEKGRRSPCGPGQGPC